MATDYGTARMGRQKIIVYTVWFPGSRMRFKLYPDGVWIVWKADRVLVNYKYSMVKRSDSEIVQTKLESAFKEKRAER